MWLGILTFGVVAISALVLALFDVAFSGGQEDTSYLEDFWQSLLRVLDPGTMAGDVGWGRRVLALLITLFGLLVAGTLIGVIAAGVENRIERMRRGRSVVFESGHVVVLGASVRLPLLVRQLVLAGAQRGGSVIVVMADRDSAEMQQDVRKVVGDMLGSRLVFRSGDPTHPPDLDLVRLDKADMVIVLGDEDAGDPRAIRTVVAVAAALGSRDSIPIVVELQERASADGLTRAYGNAVHPLVPAQAVARIAAVALREPGVGQVAVALLDDRDSDIHISRLPSLEQRTFAEALEAFPTARPIGIMSSNDEITLNPAPDTRFHPGDRVVLVSESPNEPIEFASSESLSAQSGPVETALNLEQSEQHILVWGWSDLAAYLLADWGEAASPSSSVEVLLDPSEFDGDEVTHGGEGSVVDVSMGDLSDLETRLRRQPRIDTILLCAPPTDEGEEAADSRTLLDLVGIRQVLLTLEDPPPRVIVQLLDTANIPLADMPNADDFVVSEAIAAQLIAQLAEQPERRSVFLGLYAADGASIHLVPAKRLGLEGRTSAYDVYRTAYGFGVLAIGWRRTGTHGGQLVLNPHRLQEVDLDEDDQIVVIG